MKLRAYQNEAVSAAYDALSLKKNPVLQLATGTGKSLIIAELAKLYKAEGKRVWILTHVQQLVKQNAATYLKYTGERAGVVCAGLNRKDTNESIIFGTIQSMNGVLSEMEDPDLIIIDEAHRVPHNHGEPTLYESILRRFSSALRVAMTATPWRMDNGIIYGSGKEFFFDTLAYNYTVTKAVEDKWLCPLVGVETNIQLDVDNVSVSGDFVQKEVAEAQTYDWLQSVVNSLEKLAYNRNYLAVYCPTVKAATWTNRLINNTTRRKSALLTGNMTQEEREKVLSDLASGEISVICSVDMITTGFDFPALDCIVCLRPTLSSSLWVQIQGRGTRLHESKNNCLVLDYAGNLIRLGGVDMYETFYKQNGEKVDATEPQRPYEKKPRTLYPGLTTILPIDPMTGTVAGNSSELEVPVHKVNAVVMRTRNSSQPMLMVTYTCSTPENARINATMFINTSSPKDKDHEFFRRRRMAVSLPMPANRVSYLIKNAQLPKTVKVKKNGKYWNVITENFNSLRGAA
jgi:DNA repair protein RadD